MDEFRFVIDESSLVTSEPASDTFREHLLDLVEQIHLAHQREEPVGVISSYWTWLETALSKVDRDLEGSAWRVFDKCRYIDEDPTLYIDPEVTISSGERECYGLAAAYSIRERQKFVGAITLGKCHAESLEISQDGRLAQQVLTVWNALSRTHFYQAAMYEEVTNEEEFFARASLAFPNVRFASTVTFRRFQGRFTDLLPQVVRHLSILDEKFISEHQNTLGRADDLGSRLGLPISLESRKTRSSTKLMNARKVQYDGETYVCEWHSKIEPHRNRIHLAIINESSGPALLVGIFVDHLAT